jgi:serine/threonine protein kinase/Tol biopolymer transport system component
MIGETFGHFHILSRLGSGGMGVVYRAHDDKLQRTVAIKVVGRESATPAGDRVRIIEEARAASGLSHPYICTVYETGDIDGQAYIAMEYVEGRPLSESIPVGGMPIEAVVRYGIQIADALAHAHGRGVVHRDLKTANVVVSTEGRAKVLDFGLARRTAPDIGVTATRSGDAVGTVGLAGTLAYMAPEILLGQIADERGDIWALGVLLWEMATGELPFKGRNEFDLTAAILRAPLPPLPSSVPPMIRAIIQRCLAKEPPQRYQHAMEVRAALEAVQSDVSAPVAPAAAPISPRHPARRTTGVWAAAILLVIVLIATVVLWRQRDTRSPWQRVASEGRLTLALASEEPVFDPTLSPDGKMLCYALEDPNGRIDLFVRRVAGGALVRVTNDDARESSPRFSPDGERIAFTRRESADDIPAIRIVATLGGDPLGTLEGGLAPIWSPDGQQMAYLKRGAGGAFNLVIGGVNGTDTRVVLEADSAYPFLREPAWAPDGDEIAIVRGSGGVAGEIWLIPTHGGEPRRAMTDPPEVFSDSPAYTPDGLGLIHSSNRGGATNIWFQPRAGGALVRLTTGAGPDLAPSVAADGTVAYVSSRWRNTIDVHGVRDGASRTLVTHSPFLWGPTFSPDGKSVAFSRSEVDGSWHIWTIPIDGGAPKRLTETSRGEVYPRYARDGSAVLFHTWGTPRRIGRASVEGGSVRMLSFGDASDAFPDLSPDDQIAFTRTDRDAERIYVAAANEGRARLLSATPGAVPKWSPDGRMLAFAANRGYQGGIFLIGADGANQRRLTASGGWPVWWPDGKQIGYLTVGKNGGQEIQIVPLTGGAPRPLGGIRFNGTNHLFDVSPDGSMVVSSNALHVSDEIWLLEPRAR